MKVKLKKLLSYLVSFAVCLPILFSSVSPALAAGPVADPDNLSISGASGNLVGGKNAFIIGDTVAATYDASGLAEDPIAVLFDFAEFGGSPVVGEKRAGGGSFWDCYYQISPGSIDVTDADVKVSILGSEPGPWISDNEDHAVDNQAPVISGTGTISVETKSNTHSSSTKPAIGDTIKFEKGTLTDANGDTIVYEADLTIPTGAKVVAGDVSNPVIENSTNGSSKFSVSAVDDAGNVFSGALWTNSKIFDTKRPTLSSARTISTTVIEASFSEEIYENSIDKADFEISNPAKTIQKVERTATSKVEITTDSAYSSGATPTVKIVDDGDDRMFDSAGNLINLPAQTDATDEVLPQVGPDVTGLVFSEGKNDLGDSLRVGFSENIPVFGSSDDFGIIYDGDGDFSTSADQRVVQAISLSNPESDNTVDVSIADQSGEIDAGGKFKVEVNATGNVKDASGNFVDASANTATSDFVSTFDSFAPIITAVGLNKQNETVGIGGEIIVFAELDDIANDKYLDEIGGTFNGTILDFAFNPATSRYEVKYQVVEGAGELSGVEALDIQFKDRAQNISNVKATQNSQVNIDGERPDAPVVSDPAQAIILNSDTYKILGSAQSGTKVEIYSDPNADGDISDGALSGSADVTVASFSIEVDLLQDAQNNFVAVAIDQAGNRSALVVLPTIAEDSSPPEAPSGFTIRLEGDYVDLSWEKTEGAIFYEVWRSASPYKLLATLDAQKLTYRDSTIEKGKTYYYYVAAIDGSFNRSQTVELSVSVPLATTASATSTATTQQTQETQEGVVVLAQSNDYVSPIAVEKSEPTPTAQESATPEVKGVQTEESDEGETWWPLLIPALAVLLFGAIIPLSATSAIAVPIVGALGAMAVAAYTSGSMKSSTMYLLLGAETIILLLLNYYLLGRQSQDSNGNGVVETVIRDTKEDSKEKESSDKNQSKSKNSKNSKNKKKRRK